MSDLSVAIGVLTFKRTESLEQLLPRLLAQLDTLPSDIRGEILVIDNDPERSAESTVSGFHSSIRYINEPIPGIAAARQRCLEEAVEFDLLQFIDDDDHDEHVRRTRAALRQQRPVSTRRRRCGRSSHAGSRR